MLIPNRKLTMGRVQSCLVLVLCAMCTTVSCDGPSTPQPIDPAKIPKPRVIAEEDYITLPNGLKYYDFKEGTGKGAEDGDIVAVHYHGWLTDSTLFDSSFLREEPFEFTVGVGLVIAGWDVGVLGMGEGGERQLIIPPELAYGSTPRPRIPANSTLIFELFMVQVNL